MRIFMNYKDGDEVVTDCVTETDTRDNLMIDCEFTVDGNSLASIKIHTPGGYVELTADEVLQIVRAGFNL